MMEALGEDVLTTPPVKEELLITEEMIVKALREMLPSMDADKATVGAVMLKLAQRFGTTKDVIKDQWRGRLREILPDLLDLRPVVDKKEEKQEFKQEEEDEEEEEDVRPSRKRAATKRPAVDESEEEEDDNDSDASEAEPAQPEDDNDDDEKVEEDEEEVTPVKKRRLLSSGSSRHREKKPPTKKAKTADPPGLASLKELGRAAGILNPRIYKLLNAASSTEEAEEIVRDRLHEAGVSFAGSYPSSRDISAAKRKHDKDKELEGIDTSLIISGGRSRRSAPRISYKEEPLSGEDKDAEEDDDDAEDDGEESEPESAGSGSDSEAAF